MFSFMFCKTRIIFSFLLILCALFFSCSNDQNNDRFNSDTATIKQLTLNRDEQLLWTRELESVRLLLDLKKNQSVSEKIFLEPVVMISANTGKNPIYPILEDFGSLDTSGITKELRVFLDEFCNNVASWKTDALNIKSSSLFSLILFKYDLESKWSENFGVSFPEINEDSKIFDSWFYGEPFINDNEIQLPVRLICNSGIVDLKLFIDSSENFKIDGIQIIKWEKK